jgi:hypothetical protein
MTYPSAAFANALKPGMTLEADVVPERRCQQVSPPTACEVKFHTEGHRAVFGSNLFGELGCEPD